MFHRSGDNSENAVVPFARGWRQRVFVGALGGAVASIALLRFLPFEPAHVVTAGDTVVYRPSAWWPALLALPGVLMLLISIAVVTVPHRLARLLGAAGLLGSIAIVITAPTSLVGELVITPEDFSHTTGFWWAPETRTIRFDSLVLMRVVPEAAQAGPPSFQLECHRRDGEVVVIPKSTVLEAGLPTVLANAAQRGVIVVSGTTASEVD